MAASLTESLVFLLVFSFSVSADQRIITAEPGDNVILTCRADENKEVIIVEWRRTDLESDHFVLLYKDSQLYPEGQPPSFSNRVDLLDEKNGDVSLVLKNVTTNDTGTYECRVDYSRNNRRKRSLLDTDPISIIKLIVEAGNKDGGNKDEIKEGEGNKDGQEEDGGCWSVWIVGYLKGLVILFGLIASFSLAVNFLLYRTEHVCVRDRNLSPAAGVELVPINPVNHPPAEE